MHVCMYVCSVCVYVCMHACMCLFIYVNGANTLPMHLREPNCCAQVTVVLFLHESNGYNHAVSFQMAK